MAEWLNARVCKTRVRKGYGGSNPPPGTKSNLVAELDFGTSQAQCKQADVAQLAERSLGKTEVSSSILDIGSLLRLWRISVNLRYINVRMVNTCPDD